MAGTRQAVVESLIALADDADYRIRADAGRALAVFADVPGAREPLLVLVLDGGDTFVTRVTAEALLRRQDTVGYALVARALGDAEGSQLDWIHDAVREVFLVHARERDAALGECRSLLDDADDRVVEGARQLVDTLSALSPLLHPVAPLR